MFLKNPINGNIAKWSYNLTQENAVRGTTNMLMHKLMINKNKIFCVSDHWNDVSVPSWKVSQWLNDTDCKVEGQDRWHSEERHHVYCSAFFAMSLYKSWQGAITASTSTLNFKYQSTELATSKKLSTKLSTIWRPSSKAVVARWGLSTMETKPSSSYDSLGTVSYSRSFSS